MKIRLRQLRAFKAIVETGSVSDAAILLCLTQSTVSKALAGFEDELGFRLFERVGRRLRLSEQGRIFYRKTSNALELLEGIQTTAAGIRDNQGERLSVCAIGPIALSGLIPETFSRFSSISPEFTYSFEMKPRIEIEDWVSNRNSDIGFTLLPVDSGRLNSRTLVRVRAVVAMPECHELSNYDVLSPELLQNSDVIMPKASVRLRGLVEAGFIQAGVELRPKFETSNAIVTVSLVARNLGVAIVDPFTLTGIHYSSLKVLEWEPETILNYGLIWPKDRSLTHHEEFFFENSVRVLGQLQRKHPFLHSATVQEND
ncbi:MAG: LysR family transcriptional regulator [Albidovulum sp.]|nr:LysR family transcriptional regulator [Albidovulum sp.]